MLLSTVGATTSSTTAEILVMLKAWLSTHTVLLYYPLIEPIEKEITNENLISQLEVLNKAVTYEGTTHVCSVNYPSPIFEVEHEGTQELITDEQNGTLKSFKINDKIFDNDSWIGKAICKTVTIETLDDMDLSGYEVKPKVMISLDNGVQEIIPFGNYIIDKPTNKQAKTHTTNTGYDYMTKFRIPYTHRLGDTFTAGQLFDDICDQSGVEAGDTTFTNSTYVILGNPYNNNETCEDVLKEIARLAVGFAKIGRDNKCYIKNLTIGSPVDNITGMDYTDEIELYGEYGEINALYVGLSQIDGETTVRKDDTSIAENGENAIKNDDISLLPNEEQRELVIDNMWNQVHGLKYMGASFKYKGFPYLDAGDEITLADKNDTNFTSYIFDNTFEYTGAFVGTIETPIATQVQKQLTSVKNNNVKNMFKRVEVAINKIDGDIAAIVEQEDENTQQISQMKINIDGVSSEVSKKVGEDEIVSKINQSAEAIQIDADKINIEGKAVKFSTELEYPYTYTSNDLTIIREYIADKLVVE